MSHTRQLVLVLAVGLSVAVFMHWLVWARLFRDTAAPRWLRRSAALGLALLLLALPLANIVARARGPQPWVWVALLWMGASFYLFVSLLAADLVFLAARLAGPLAPARRTALRRWLGGAAAFVTATATGAGMYEALRRLRVVDIEVPLARLPAAFDGFTIVQVSDIHVGSTIGRPFIEGLVQRINALSPDLVAITGDLVDGPVSRLGHATAPLQGLRSTHGTYFVTGNHEYYSGAAPWMVELERLGIRVLRNERVPILGSDGNLGFQLAGVDDWRSKDLAPGHGPNLAAALAGYDPAQELVLLAHQPAQALEAQRLGVGLQLSGHTHGGQLWPFRYLVRLQQPFIAGLDRLGQLWVYTSRGTGYWGPPMRVGEPAEITRIRLRARSSVEAVG